jgi:hypothetical protein
MVHLHGAWLCACWTTCKSCNQICCSDPCVQSSAACSWTCADDRKLCFVLGGVVTSLLPLGVPYRSQGSQLCSAGQQGLHSVPNCWLTWLYTRSLKPYPITSGRPVSCTDHQPSCPSTVCCTSRPDCKGCEQVCRGHFTGTVCSTPVAAGLAVACNGFDEPRHPWSVSAIWTSSGVKPSRS